MSKPAVTTEIHEALDVHRDLALEVTFNLEVLVDALANLLDLCLIELFGSLVLRNPSDFTDLLRDVRTDAVNVLERDHRVLTARNIDACNACHL